MGYADVETTATGYLANVEDWTEDIAKEIAAAEEIPELTDKHWDLIKYLRDEYINNGGNQPNDRTIVKAMSKAWGEKVSTKELYDMFRKQPSKVAGKIGGLPESKRKAGY